MTVRAVAMLLGAVALTAQSPAQQLTFAMEPELDRAGGARELAEIQAILSALENRVEWAEFPVESTIFADVSLRLALFEARFGLLAAQCEGWRELQLTAQRLLPCLREQVDVPLEQLELGYGWGWCSDRFAAALLLELSGDVEAARAFVFRPRDEIPTDHWTTFHYVDADWTDIGWMRSLYLARQGDTRAAWDELMSGQLTQTGCMGDSGQEAVYAAWLYDLQGLHEIARLLRLRAADARFDPIGSRLAREALGLDPDVRPESGAMIFSSRHFDGPAGAGPPWNRSCLISSIGLAGDPDSWRVLAARVSASDANRMDALHPVWRPEDLPGVRGLLATLAASEGGGDEWGALLHLHALDRSARGRLPRMFEELADRQPALPRSQSWDASRSDEVARLICGTGPVLPEEISLTSRDVALIWLRWLEP